MSLSEGDHVIANFCKWWFPVGQYNKLSKKYGHFRVLEKLGDNAYFLELPSSVVSSSIFNIDDLYRFHWEPVKANTIFANPNIQKDIPDRSDYIVDIKELQIWAKHCRSLAY